MIACVTVLEGSHPASLQDLAVAPHLGFLGCTGVFRSLLSEQQQ